MSTAHKLLLQQKVKQLMCKNKKKTKKITPADGVVATEKEKQHPASSSVRLSVKFPAVGSILDGVIELRVYLPVCST